MKYTILSSILMAAALPAQVIEVVPAGPPGIVVEEAVVEELPPTGLPPEIEALHNQQHFAPIDPAVVRRQFAIDPRVVEIPALPPRVVEVETTVEEVVPRRIYDAKRSVVVVVEEDEARELPYVTMPVLFVKDSDELLDDRSREAIEEMAGLILETAEAEPEAVFDIEGHTSTDGSDEHNMKLSGDRARRIYDELTRRYAVPASMLTAHGYGENYPQYPQGTEAEMTLDRRVLIVRVE